MGRKISRSVIVHRCKTEDALFSKISEVHNRILIKIFYSIIIHTQLRIKLNLKHNGYPKTCLIVSICYII